MKLCKDTCGFPVGQIWKLLALIGKQLLHIGDFIVRQSTSHCNSQMKQGIWHCLCNVYRKFYATATCKSGKKAILGKPSHIISDNTTELGSLLLFMSMGLVSIWLLNQMGTHCTHLMQNKSQNFMYQILNVIYVTQTFSLGSSKSFLFFKVRYYSAFFPNSNKK